MGEQGWLDVTFCNANYGEVWSVKGALATLRGRFKTLIVSKNQA